MSSTFNTYFSGNPLNRLSYLRSSPAFLSSALSSPKSKFLLFDSLSPLTTAVTKEGTKHLKFLDFEQIKSTLPDPKLIFVGVDGKDEQALGRIDRSSAEENQGENEKLSAEDKIKHYTSIVARARLFRVDERSAPESAKSLPLSKPTAESTLESHSPHGIPYWAIDASKNETLKKLALEQSEGLEFGELRSGMAMIPPDEASIAAEGRAMIDWNTRNRYCPSCARPLKSVWAGWKRACIPLEAGVGEPCASKKGVNNYSYPRTDPVVIMGVVSEDGESILLGRQKSWPRGFYSALAGFIEAGETFEEAVAREVYEEAGVEVYDVKFVANQVWPFPSSLMMGGIAKAKPGQSIRLDLDNELEDARYFTRTEVLNVINSSGPVHLTRDEVARIDGKEVVRGSRSRSTSPQARARPAFRMPPPTAIANTLITAWATNQWEGGNTSSSSSSGSSTEQNQGKL